MKEEDNNIITKEEYAIIEAVRKLRHYDKVIVQKNQGGSKVVWTLVRQDQFAFET